MGFNSEGLVVLEIADSPVLTYPCVGKISAVLFDDEVTSFAIFRKWDGNEFFAPVEVRNPVFSYAV